MFLQAAGKSDRVYQIRTGKRRKAYEALAKWNARRLPSGNLTYMENMSMAH